MFCVLCLDGLTQHSYSYLLKAIRYEQVCEQIVPAAFVPPLKGILGREPDLLEESFLKMPSGITSFPDLFSG